MNAKIIGFPVVMAALLAAALATGTVIYYGLFIVLAIMLVFSAVSVIWALSTVRVELNGMRSRVARGETLAVTLNIRHTSVFPIGKMVVVMDIPGSFSGVQEISVDPSPYTNHRFRNTIRCPHRGEYSIGLTAVRVEDIFGLFSFKRKLGKKSVRITVIPGTANVEPMKLQASDLGPEFRSRASEDNAAPSDVRSWQDGDELKKVHWKLTMRKRELMVRTFEESARPDTLIIPDVTQITALRDQRLTIEDCICEAALSVAKAQLEVGYPVRMPLQAKLPTEISGRWSTDLPVFTDALTRVQFDSPYTYEQLLAQMTQRSQRTGAMVIITGRLTTHIADIAMRLQMTSVRVRLIYVSEAPRKEALEMLERVKMSGAEVECIDPRAEGGYAGSRGGTDFI